MLDFLLWMFTPAGWFYITERCSDVYALDDDWRRWLVGFGLVVGLVLLFIGYAYLVAAILG